MFSFSLLVPYRLLLGGVLCSNALMASAFDGSNANEISADSHQRSSFYYTKMRFPLTAIKGHSFYYTQMRFPLTAFKGHSFYYTQMRFPLTAIKGHSFYYTQMRFSSDNHQRPKP